MTRLSHLTLRNFLIALHDLLATTAALFAAFYLRFEGDDGFFARLPPDLRRRAFATTLAAASSERPIAWISAEGAGVIDTFAGVDAPSDATGIEASVFGLVNFRDGGVDTSEVLGFVHPHGSAIDWRI